ncbi:MAG: hypothetical protein AB7O43_13430 [Hyphomicrobiaceae bacterium]
MGLPQLGTWLIACVLTIWSAEAEPLQGINAEVPGWHARIVRADPGVYAAAPAPTSSAPDPSAPEADTSSASAMAPMEISWTTLLGLAGTALLPVLAWLALMARRTGPGDATGNVMAIVHQHAAPDRHGDGLPVPACNAIEIETLHGRAARLAIEIRESLDRLPPSMPLRQVLAREFASAVKRLDALLSEHQSSLGVHGKGLPQLTAVVADMDRLAAISAGARSSLTGHAAPDPTSEPRTKTEAYRLLGINPDVDERISKKLVDALRQSWHPDHARGEADRRLRENRIKVINVAWDLIRSKHA